MLTIFKVHCIRLLRWSEKYTKTDMVYLASGGFWSIAGQVASSLMTLALAIIIARYFPKDAYGTYKYILSIVALLSVFSLNSFGSAVFQSVAHGHDGALQDGFRKNLTWSALIIVGTILVASYYFSMHNSTLAIGVLIGGCLSPLLASANLASTFLVAKRDFRLNGIYFGVIDTVLPAAALIAAAYLSDNPLVLLAVYFIGNTFSTLVLYYFTLVRYHPDPQKTDPEMLTYSKHLSFMGVLSAFAGNLDQILLFHFGGAIDLAVYNFAIAIPDQVKGPQKMFDSMTQAGFATRSDAEIRQGMSHKLLLLAITYTTAVIAYWFIAPYIFELFFPTYMDAVFYSRIYMLSLLIFPLDTANSYLVVKKKVREQYISTIASSIFQLAVMVLGLIWWGLVGLIIARVLSRYFSIVLLYMLYETASSSGQPEIAS